MNIIDIVESELREQIVVLESDNKVLKSEIIRLEKENRELKEGIGILENVNDVLRNEIKDLRDRILILEDIRDEELDMAQREWNLDIYD